MTNADAAMYQAKQNGRNRYVLSSKVSESGDEAPASPDSPRVS